MKEENSKKKSQKKGSRKIKKTKIIKIWLKEKKEE